MLTPRNGSPAARRLGSADHVVQLSQVSGSHQPLRVGTGFGYGVGRVLQALPATP
ncbi:hypothetical protein [Pseudonocardia sp.]|uniref:hypothetical protein n=1 Tax=Pseudonocardia sp. TaxID=60912 RepID=UPI0031FE22B8